MELDCLLWMLPVTLLGFFIPGCPPCCGSASSSCLQCCNGVANDNFEVTIAGVADGTCTACEVINGTYIVTRSGTGSSPCLWVYTQPDPDPDLGCSGLHSGRVFAAVNMFIQQVGSDMVLNVNIRTTRPFGSTLEAQLRGTIGAGVACPTVLKVDDCAALDGMVLSTLVTDGGIPCDFTAASASIAAL